jgi:NAD(P)-dependent dehydrogenase (short-subunit alcohol dehydrogenase family)
MKLIHLMLMLCSHTAIAFNIVLAGGTGEMGRALSSSLVNDGHDVTILCRNAFLAAAPARVTEEFGWLGKSFLSKHPTIRLRDWDGGDLLDIVGQDWIGWQEDTLAKADAVVNLVGGFTQQREMATERIIRESYRVNPNVLQISVGPRDDELDMFQPVIARPLKMDRLQKCEEMVKMNCANFECLRLEANRIEQGCDEIKKVICDRLK